MGGLSARAGRVACVPPASPARISHHESAPGGRGAFTVVIYAVRRWTTVRIRPVRTMIEPNQKRGEANGVTGVTPEDAEVRATIEQTREALESSGAELERARRLLRETEKRVDEAGPPAPHDARSAVPSPRRVKGIR